MPQLRQNARANFRIGETGIVVVPAAIAVFNALGKRLRELRLTPDNTKSG